MITKSNHKFDYITFHSEKKVKKQDIKNKLVPISIIETDDPNLVLKRNSAASRPEKSRNYKILPDLENPGKL
ncbi:hypothetical protein RIR_jg26742.t1 [Rhizophagus irregularis DAOM 181602=DAOM 197198]|nr:hypothetical protein RIR_jg26742.t1 [Rhizophagus irregularis DAOM 181602=DAOM 197198]